VYETRKQKPLTRGRFLRRLLAHAGAALGLIGLSLLLGMWGYMAFEHLPAIDAFLNCAMLLGGMGPVDAPASEAGKIFAGMFALYAGLVFIVSAALLVTPVIHRFLHRFHWDEK
jgi:hypothetical protein